MAELLRMPEIAAAMTEAVIQEWKVAENATFAAGDTLAEIETDKAVIDFEAEAPGVVLRLLAEAGVTIDVGAPIAVIGAADEAGADVDALLAELGVTGASTGEPDASAPAAGAGSTGSEDGAEVRPGRHRGVGRRGGEDRGDPGGRRTHRRSRTGDGRSTGRRRSVRCRERRERQPGIAHLRQPVGPPDGPRIRVGTRARCTAPGPAAGSSAPTSRGCSAVPPQRLLIPHRPPLQPLHLLQPRHPLIPNPPGPQRPRSRGRGPTCRTAGCGGRSPNG